jgi:hypothetical protein
MAPFELDPAFVSVVKTLFTILVLPLLILVSVILVGPPPLNSTPVTIQLVDNGAILGKMLAAFVTALITLAVVILLIAAIAVLRSRATQS